MFQSDRSSSMQMDALTRQVADLRKRQNTFLCGIAAVASMLLYQAASPLRTGQDSESDQRELVIRDSGGRVRAYFGVEESGEVALKLFDEHGISRVQLSLERIPHEANSYLGALRFMSGTNQRRIELKNRDSEVHGDGQTLFFFPGPNEKGKELEPYLQMGRAVMGPPGFDLFDPLGRAMIRLGFRELSAAPYLSLKAPHHDDTESPWADECNPSVLLESEGKSRINVEIASGGTPRVVMSNAAGKDTARLP